MTEYYICRKTNRRMRMHGIITSEAILDFEEVTKEEYDSLSFIGFKGKNVTQCKLSDF